MVFFLTSNGSQKKLTQEKRDLTRKAIQKAARKSLFEKDISFPGLQSHFSFRPPEFNKTD
jgi:hypothetical protein